jgi:L-amino acid N-acyltransferase YncA
LNLFSSCGFEQSGTNRDWVKKGKVFINAVFMQRLR